MKRYLISFDDDAMTFPEEDGPAVAEAAHAVFREATDAGPRVCGALRLPPPPGPRQSVLGGPPSFTEHKCAWLRERPLAWGA
jgi:hypothetical protein